MVAKLKGVEYCPEASIAAAATASGAAELASPSCPGNSQVGKVGIDVGSGPAPFHTAGKAYLAGPYKGAPISMVFVIPAVAGPYDLGTDRGPGRRSTSTPKRPKSTPSPTRSRTYSAA